MSRVGAPPAVPAGEDRFADQLRVLGLDPAEDGALGWELDLGTGFCVRVMRRGDDVAAERWERGYIEERLKGSADEVLADGGARLADWVRRIRELAPPERAAEVQALRAAQRGGH